MGARSGGGGGSFFFSSWCLLACSSAHAAAQDPWPRCLSLFLSLSLSLSTTSCLCVRVRVRACAHANVPLRIWRGGRSEYKRNRTSEGEIVKHGFGGRLLEQLVQFDHLLCAPKVVACRQGGVSSVFPSDSASTLMGHDMKCMNDIIYSAPLLSSPLLFCPPSFSKSPLQGTQTRTQ